MTENMLPKLVHHHCYNVIKVLQPLRPNTLCTRHNGQDDASASIIKEIE